MKKIAAAAAAMLCIFLSASVVLAQAVPTQAGLVPFLCFTWDDMADDPEACREIQPVHCRIEGANAMTPGYRLVLGKMEADYLDGYIIVENGPVWELEMVWNGLIHTMTKAGFEGVSQSFSGDYCRLCLQFEKVDTVAVMKVMYYPGGARIEFSCSKN